MQYLSAFLLFVMLLPFQATPLFTQNKAEIPHIIQPGDTWAALSFRVGVPTEILIETFGIINPQQQPVIGTPVWLHDVPGGNGQFIRPRAGGLLETAARNGRSPWNVAIKNNLRHPYTPLFYTPIFLPGGNYPPREMPVGFEELEISDSPAKPGVALALRARSQPEIEAQVSLDNEMWQVYRNEDRLLALGATGAFFVAVTPELRIQVGQHPLWTQPLLFEEKSWYFDQVAFAATAANEQEEILLERERLQGIWEQVTPEPFWPFTFTWPLEEYVELTSHYGARRSVNGGPYDTYHEGTDFSAYGGTPVYAPADGRVVLADSLIVRGGSVILDHGFGIHTGYYHLSDIKTQRGDIVFAGDLIGEVGTTGRSTGNHLHWDLLIGTTWVDAEEWMSSNLAAWIGQAWGDQTTHQDRKILHPTTGKNPSVN